MAYGMPKGCQGRVAYCPIAVQQYCNSVGNAGGPEEWMADWLVHTRFEVKQYLVKVKSRPGGPGLADSPPTRRVMEPCRKLGLKVLCSYLVTAICKFALLMYMSEFCCYVLLNFWRRSPAIYPSNPEELGTRDWPSRNWNRRSLWVAAPKSLVHVE